MGGADRSLPSELSKSNTSPRTQSAGRPMVWAGYPVAKAFWFVLVTRFPGPAKFRVRSLLPPNPNCLFGWLRKLKAEKRNSTLCRSVILKVLNSAKIAIEERRAVNIGPDQRAVGAIRRRSEATRVEVLAGFQISAWVAGQQRYQGQICGVGAQPSLRTYTDSVSVDNRVAVVGVHGAVGVRLNRRASLELTVPESASRSRRLSEPAILGPDWQIPARSPR